MIILDYQLTVLGQASTSLSSPESIIYFVLLWLSEELILFGFSEFDSRMLKMILEHNEGEEHGVVKYVLDVLITHGEVSCRSESI